MNLKNTIKPIYLKLQYTGLFNWIPDEIFLKIEYYFATGKKLNLGNPVTFNEKIQWIKLYDHNPLYSIFVDKYAVREYVKNTVGEKYLIPLIAKYNHCSEIDIDKLPKEFVLKCNHDSGGISICRDKNHYDWKKEKKILEKHLGFNFYYQSREWAYKDVKPCIICEELIENPDGSEINDYKFFSFNGQVKAIQVDFDRHTNHKRNIYTPDFQLVDLSIKCPNDPKRIIPIPEKLDEMIRIAESLSRGFPEIRVDLYSVGNKIYFGELTLYHGGGIEKFTPGEQEYVFGSWIDLNLVTKHE